MARPEHESTAEVRRREHAFAHWRAEIVRGAIDQRTLNQELHRALGDPDVRKDSKLDAMIRDFANQRQHELAKLKPQHTAGQSIGMRPDGASAVKHPDSSVSSPEDTRAAADRLARQFDDYATRFFEAEARETYDRLRELAEAHPQWIDPSIPSHCQELLGKLATRRQEFSGHIEELAKRAVRAAEVGDHDLAAKILRRLAGVNAAHPQLLPDDQFALIRDRMSKAGTVHEHRAAIELLVARERAVAGELKSLTHAVHHFHHVSRSAPHDGKEYREAEAAYVAALKAVRSHDEEWLAGLILELVDILSVWTHPPHQVEEQLDRFVANVRKSLHHLRREIRQVQDVNQSNSGSMQSPLTPPSGKQ